MCFPVHHGPGCFGPGDIMCSPGGFRAVTGGPSIFGCGYPPPPMMGCHSHGLGHSHCYFGRESRAVKTGALLGTAVGVTAGVSLCKTGALLGSIGGPIGALVGGVAGLALGALAGKAFARS
jgi:hypothetical protein